MAVPQRHTHSFAFILQQRLQGRVHFVTQQRAGVVQRRGVLQHALRRRAWQREQAALQRCCGGRARATAKAHLDNGGQLPGQTHAGVWLCVLGDGEQDVQDRLQFRKPAQGSAEPTRQAARGKGAWGWVAAETHVISSNAAVIMRTCAALRRRARGVAIGAMVVWSRCAAAGAAQGTLLPQTRLSGPTARVVSTN